MGNHCCEDEKQDKYCCKGQRFEIVIITLSNGHIVPVMLDGDTGKTWQGHLVGGNLSWRNIEIEDDIK